MALRQERIALLQGVSVLLQGGPATGAPQAPSDSQVIMWESNQRASVAGGGFLS